MSVGIDFLTRCIDTSDIMAFRGVPQTWYTQDELPVYTVVTNHLREYGVLPSRAVIIQYGTVLPSNIDQPIEFYRTNCFRRYIISNARQASPEFLQSIQTQDVQRLQNFLVGLSNSFRDQPNHLHLTTFHDESQIVMERERAMASSVDLMSGVTTGYSVVDLSHGGLQPGELSVLVGRPNHGKSFILLKMIVSAWLAGHSPLVISLEMSNTQMTMRSLALMSGITPNSFKRGELGSFGREYVHGLINETANLPPFYFLSGEVRKSVKDIEDAIILTNPDIIYIDAGYLLDTDSPKFINSRPQLIAKVMEDLKSIAARQNKHIVTSVQLNRAAGQLKRNAAPEVDMIAETDTIGQIAALIMGILPSRGVQNSVERIIAIMKDREGPLYRFKTHFRIDTPVCLDFIEVLNEDDEDDEEESPSQQRRRIQTQAREGLARYGWTA